MFVSTAKEKFGIPGDAIVCLMDETGTEVDEEVFSDVINKKSDILWTIDDAYCVIGKNFYTFSVPPALIDASQRFVQTSLMDWLLMVS